MRNTTEYLRRARELERSPTEGGTAVRLAVLSSFTASLLRPYLIVEADDLDFTLRPWFAPFNVFESELLNPSSSLWTERPDVIWLAMRPEDVDPGLVDEFPGLSVAKAVDRIGAVRVRLVELARSVRRTSNASILVSNMGLPNRLDIFDGSNPDGLGHLVAEENRQLARDLTQVPGAQAFDWNRLVAECGQRRWHDPKLWYMARCPLSAEAQPLLARRLCRCIRAVLVAPGKCIVVDLDNTLWGGVLGDDGADGILLGHDYPGSAFRDLQSALLQLHRRGFLLAVASKNDEDIVRRTLDQHPDMLVRTSDFAAILANWDPKPWNLRLIAERLNIGLDSLVFIDDNPVERAEVRSELPMVKVVDLPTEPAGYCSALLELAVLDRPKLLAEDRGRAVLYREDAERREAGRSAESLDQFLADLNMVAVVGRCGPREIDRVHQLIQKTNQFNLTTRRHRFEEIDLLCRTPDAVVAWMRLSDRFGDMGLVCVGILRRLNEQVWEVDTFLMSCRVMGRKAEDAFLAYLFDLVGQGDRRVRGIYRRSEKNQMVSDFYQSHGFVERGGSTDEMVFESERDHRPLWPAHIARKDSIEDK